ncbi:MAG: hypothetical protein ACQKBT_06820, partial [Puniceicoccales bacterium]
MKPAYGIGVVYDDYGTLWTSGGDGSLKRYTVDGRQVGTYPTKRMGGRLNRDKIALVDGTLVLKLDERLFTLRTDAPNGSSPAELPFRASRMASHAVDGWIVAARGKEVFRFNPAGEKLEIAEMPESVRDIEQGPEGVIYVEIGRNWFALDDLETELDFAGEKAQWLNGFWFGHGWHGTIRRFDRDLSPDPGVVLGGNSGSFIGYVPGNYELLNGQGMAYLGNDIYAVAGHTGILHLLEWSAQAERFSIVRRIGSVRTCKALGLDSAGRVWHHGGVWEWEDGPAAPLEHGIPNAGAPSALGPNSKEVETAAVLEGDILVGTGPYNDEKGIFFSGVLTGPVRRNLRTDPMKDYVAIAPLEIDKRQAVILLDSTGRGKIISVSRGDGRPQGEMEAVELSGVEPMKELTSAAVDLDGDLWVAAKGEVIQIERMDGAWKEKSRWKQWSGKPSGSLGDRIYLAISGNHLWVSDTNRNRVLVFDISSGDPEPVYHAGQLDQPGNDLESFERPAVIAAKGLRAVVFDSGNQRLV